MNEVMQRMLPATVLTLALHGALLYWRMQQPQTLLPAPLPQKISVSLKRLPPPPPPLKKIVQKAPALPKIRKVQHQPIRPILLKPEKKIFAVLLPLPKLAPVIRQSIKPLAVQPAKKSEPNITRTRTPVQSTLTSQPIRRTQPVLSRQQPVVRRMTTYRQTYQQPIRRNTQPLHQQPLHQQPLRQQTIRRTPPITRQVISSIPVRTTTRTTTQTTQPMGTPLVREATPLYTNNPPPEYPRMAKRRGLEGVVTIEAHIGINGRVEDLRLFTSSGHTILDKAALKAVRTWQFSPGTVGGKAQSMSVKVPVRFALR
ncbi:MAG: energy transducer TonB [Candidatus Electrothrix sp.]